MLNKGWSNLMYSFVQIHHLSPIPFLQFHHVLSTLFMGDKSVITVCRVHTALLSLLHHIGGLSLRINGDLYSVHTNLFIVSCSRRSDSRPPVFMLSNMITTHSSVIMIWRKKEQPKHLLFVCVYHFCVEINPEQGNIVKQYCQSEPIFFTSYRSHAMRNPQPLYLIQVYITIFR